MVSFLLDAYWDSGFGKNFSESAHAGNSVDTPDYYFEWSCLSNLFAKWFDFGSLS